MVQTMLNLVQMLATDNGRCDIAGVAPGAVLSATGANKIFPKMLRLIF
ncbi:MAG: hypothetical protein CM15mP16_06040 [Candidatus Pelagibacterales bacterium]|nr:MAG: hypothetical protein CM15mP16_06040 [Pelagibacterales bacterium]